MARLVKVHVSYTVTVSEDYRRAIRLHYGQAGLATRAEVKRWLMAHGAAEDDTLLHDLAQTEEA